MEGKREKVKVSKEGRKGSIEKRGKRKQERLTKTDRYIVESVKEVRETVDVNAVLAYPQEKKRKKGEEKADNKEETLVNNRVNPVKEKKEKKKPSNYLKLLEVLKKGEERYSYETWEARKVLRECMEDDEGYMVKANQKGRRNWSKERIGKFESDLRNYERKVPTYEEESEETEEIEEEQANEEISEVILRDILAEETEQEEREKETKEERKDWGFWKYYLEKDAQTVVVWKKGVLYKKARGKNEITSWDRVTYRKEWYDQRTTMMLRRRYVREGGFVLQKPKTKVQMVKEVELKSRVDGRESSKYERDKEKVGGKKERRKRTYYKFQNPEDRKPRMKMDKSVKRSEETWFQSILRKQIAVDMKRWKLMKKSIVVYPNKDSYKGKRWKDSAEVPNTLRLVDRIRSKKLRVWSMQVGRLRYMQKMWKLNRSRKK
jgi:hypothetical protein